MMYIFIINLKRKESMEVQFFYLVALHLSLLSQLAVMFVPFLQLVHIQV